MNPEHRSIEAAQRLRLDAPHTVWAVFDGRLKRSLLFVYFVIVFVFLFVGLLRV